MELIGVRGLKWRFVDYHFVRVPHTKEAILLTKDFYDTNKDPGETDRPKVSKTYEEGDYMDFRSDDEGKDIIRTLHWLAKNEKGRDLTFRHHANSLPNSITCSTMYIESDD